MALPSVSTQVYGQFFDFFAKLQEGQAPASFTQQHLKDIGFAKSNHRALIPLLKALGFLTANGAPTDRYHAYRDKSQSRQILGAALKEAYSDLFVIKAHPTEKDKALIEGKFKSVHNASDTTADRMARTFLGLLKLADIDHSPPTAGKPLETPPPSPPSHEPKPPSAAPPLPTHTAPGLHYNIQIHLPATKDVEVYNAIFKSLKEHLIG